MRGQVQEGSLRDKQNPRERGINALRKAAEWSLEGADTPELQGNPVYFLEEVTSMVRLFPSVSLSPGSEQQGEMEARRPLRRLSAIPRRP